MEKRPNEIFCYIPYFLIVLTLAKLGSASTLPEDTPENVGFPYWRNLSRHINNA